MLAIGCGKKGPPLPPLVRLPRAGRLRGRATRQMPSTISLVPAANTDGIATGRSRARRRLCADAAAPVTSDDEMMKRARASARVAVKTPRDPDDDRAGRSGQRHRAARRAPGLDQGAVAHVSDDRLLGAARRQLRRPRTLCRGGHQHARPPRAFVERRSACRLHAAPPAPAPAAESPTTRPADHV